ncbi:MAG: hypothetical protein WA842_03240 [Croceibacterium sp.]
MTATAETTDRLTDLAVRWEQATKDDNAALLDAFIDLAKATPDLPDLAADTVAQARLLVRAGAIETAALHLVPTDVTLTGGLFEDRSYAVAQAVLPRQAVGVHSKGARTLGAAWLAAYLRALARPAGASESD